MSVCDLDKKKSQPVVKRRSEKGCDIDFFGFYRLTAKSKGS